MASRQPREELGAAAFLVLAAVGTAGYSGLALWISRRRGNRYLWWFSTASAVTLSLLLMRNLSIDPSNLWLLETSHELRGRYWASWVVASILIAFTPLAVIAGVVTTLGNLPAWRRWLFGSMGSLLALVGALFVAFVAAVLITGDGP
jgi:hypothetical protein